MPVCRLRKAAGVQAPLSTVLCHRYCNRYGAPHPDRHPDIARPASRVWILYREARSRDDAQDDGPVEILGAFSAPQEAFAHVREIEPDLANRWWREPELKRSDGGDLYIAAEQFVYSVEWHRVDRASVAGLPA